MLKGISRGIATDHCQFLPSTVTHNPHLLLKPKTLTLSLSSSLTSMASSSPPGPATDAWEVLTPTVLLVAHVDGGLDDCTIFPPQLHEGLVLDGDPLEVAAAAAGKEMEEEDGREEEDEEDGEWRRERDLLVLLSKEKDKRIAQLLHQIALMTDIRSGSEAVKTIRNS
ncbi:hypothetical protein PVAP13_5NG265400 [Panicum virgatum]|uniref:Uncharacterized protein n=1 Tax=Panicum virgatum TaxID=38727 RepID=A0A8T0RZX7_PANVG|nr:hypothetical protein PVAP13_5NG265400 [Panicum virgatum]